LEKQSNNIATYSTFSKQSFHKINLHPFSIPAHSPQKTCPQEVSQKKHFPVAGTDEHLLPLNLNI